MLDGVTFVLVVAHPFSLLGWKETKERYCKVRRVQVVVRLVPV